MASIEKILQKMAEQPNGVRFDELQKVCEQFFGLARQSGSSHAVFKMPWAGDPPGEHSKRQGEGQGLPGAPGIGGHREVERTKSLTLSITPTA